MSRCGDDSQYFKGNYRVVPFLNEINLLEYNFIFCPGSEVRLPARWCRCSTRARTAISLDCLLVLGWYLRPVSRNRLNTVGPGQPPEPPIHRKKHSRTSYKWSFWSCVFVRSLCNRFDVHVSRNNGKWCSETLTYPQVWRFYSRVYNIVAVYKGREITAA